MLLTFVEFTGILEEEKSRLLHCVVVGGGPTGVEFSGELSDFIKRDVYDRYAHVKNYIHVTLIEVQTPDSLVLKELIYVIFMSMFI
jgi:NADH:ubiquinone reductase (non-electrogenic)